MDEVQDKPRVEKEDLTEWHLIDAASEPLGRIATRVATLLLGKHRLDYAANHTAPVRVVIINSDSIQVTGNKRNDKMYRRYTGYPGGLRERTFDQQMKLDSRRILHDAVSGMLPKNNLRSVRLQGLKIYKTAEHPHTQITRQVDNTEARKSKLETNSNA